MSEPQARDRFGKYTFVSTTYTAEKSRPSKQEISFDMWNIGENECDQMIDKSLSPASFDVNHPNIVNICCIPLIDLKNEFSSSDHTTEYANDQFPSKCSGRALARPDAQASANPRKFTTFSLTYVRFLGLVFDALSNGGNFSSWKSLFQKLDFPK